MTSRPSEFRPDTLTIAFAFALVYFFWGSTYLAIDIAVQSIPPALMCAIRFFIAGSTMLAFCAWQGRRVKYELFRLARMATVGTLLLMGGNLTLSYAERQIPSGLAALIVASTPLWFLVLDQWLLGAHRISTRGKVGLALGLAGLIVLLWPQLSAQSVSGRSQLWASLSLQLGSLLWALGSVLSKRWKSAEVDQFSGTAWQMIFAGIANMIWALANSDLARVHWTARGLAATGYLIVCGSWIGYTAYIYLLAHVPTSKVSTYAYVNPVVAVFLGWLILHERVDKFIALGSAIVIGSVALVTSAKVESREEKAAGGV